MSTATDDLLAAQTRLTRSFNRASDKFDGQLDAIEAQRREERREQARADAETNQTTVAKYQPVFTAFNIETPMPLPDEDPTKFRKYLFRQVRDRLGEEHGLSDVGTRGLQGRAFDHFEAQVLDAGMKEAATPSFSRLPANGELVERVRVDNAGRKTHEFFGRESYIKAMTSPAVVKRVVSINNPRTGDVLWGRPRLRTASQALWRTV